MYYKSDNKNSIKLIIKPEGFRKIKFRMNMNKV